MTSNHQETAGEAKPTFAGLGIAPKLMDILDKHGFVHPTPIQRQAIPVAMQGEDVIGIAQTGTGKTLAFGIPMLQRLAQFKGKALVMLPTRELALQVDEEMHKLGGSLGLKTAVLIGGASIRPQHDALKKSPHVIVGTPGRIIDHLDQRTLDLRDVKILVLDEADRMLDMGFLPQIRKILRHVPGPEQRQTMLFSATMPADIVRIAADHMRQPTRVEVAPPGSVASRVEHELFVVKKDQKMRLLESLLGSHPGSVLVFTRTKHGARRVARILVRIGEKAADIHSDRSLSQRRDALDGFKSGRYRVLVATDIASRGIDVTGLELVINYDIPANPEDYVHRIGRTGRAGRQGKAITFAMADEGEYIEQIEKLARVRLPIGRLPELPPERSMPERSDREEREPRDARGDGRGRHRSRRDGRPRSRDERGDARPQAGRPASAAPQQRPAGEGPKAHHPKPEAKPSAVGQQGDRKRSRRRGGRGGSSKEGGRPAGPRSVGGGGAPDLGIDLWPDTPNLHGGLNRKKI
jgi:ATP-dependent RNA helicase RhlE